MDYKKFWWSGADPSVLLSFDLLYAAYSEMDNHHSADCSTSAKIIIVNYFIGLLVLTPNISFRIASALLASILPFPWRII